MRGTLTTITTTLTFSMLVRKTLNEVEKAHSDAMAERNAAEQRLQLAEKRIGDLETKLDEEGRESSDLDMLHKRLSEELEEERKQHLKDLADRDFTTDQTRKKYQGKGSCQAVWHILLISVYSGACPTQRRSV